jgi:serine/threonine-protein kinase
MSERTDSDRWRRVAQVLDDTLACQPERRSEVLDASCAGAPELRHEVEDLLSRLDRAQSFLDSPPAALAAAAVAESDMRAQEHTGRRIGAYRIEREIGRGGMARVFLAERADGAFEQRVALKLLRPGLDAEIDHARFRAERQILASLNHPNIARLLDGGLTDSLQPYLALEYVEGQPIDAYCEEHGLTVRQRLALFLMVADATQYAHRNLIVHRDIKPSNILVSVDGAVKLLDFGLAKLVDPGIYGRGSSSAPHTVAEWMTPEYAAPEQFKREPVTTLTDVYQLGVVLFRMLTGRLPFVAATGDIRELEAAVEHEDPTAPSIAVAATDPSLARALRGDLDAIVLKAMRKEPGERYASVDALADDLRRHLSGHPVAARRNTSFYRARRFVRRHRIETVAALSISISVLVGAGLALWQAQRAAGERDLAAIASRESQAATDFVMGLFETSDPAETAGDTLTAQQLVHRAAAHAERLRGQPLVQAQMLEITGRLYQSLGQYNETYNVLERALAIRRSMKDHDAIDVANTLGQLAEVQLRLGHYVAADSAAREALSIQQHALGQSHPAIAKTLHQVANIAIYRGDLATAELYHRRALAMREATLGPDDSLTAESHLTLGAMFRREGKLTDAERELRTGRSIFERTIGPDSPRVADAIVQIAYLLDDIRARYAEAEPLYRQALQIRRRAFGDGHPMVAATMLDLAELLSHRGDHTQALQMGRQAVDIGRRAYGAEHPFVASFTGRLAVIVFRGGELTEAETLFRQAIAMDQRLLGADHENIAGLEMGLAHLLIARRDYAGADSAVHDAIRIRERAAGPQHPGAAMARGLHGMLLAREGNFIAADSTLRQALETLEHQVGRDHPDVRELYEWLADVQDARGRRDAAARYRAIAAVR